MAAYDLPVVPHGSGPCSYHAIFDQPRSPFCEYVAAAPDGRSVLPCFGSPFRDEGCRRTVG